MPLLGTSASATAKGYGFGLLSSVNESTSVSGVATTAAVGTVRAFAPKPKPANQYWGAARWTQNSPPFGTDFNLNIDVFSFDQDPSPVISSIGSSSNLTVKPGNVGTPLVASTNNGVCYVMVGYNSDSATGVRIASFDISTGSAPVLTIRLQFSYSTTGAFRFIQRQGLSARPSGTRIAAVYNYLNSSALTRFQVGVWDINTDGSNPTGVSAQNPLAVATYNQRAIALNPVYNQFLAICGDLVSNSATGYVWVYRNWGVALQETLQVSQAGPQFVALKWSNNGIYLVASTGSTNYIFKMNTSTGALTLLSTHSGGSSLTWTVDDESIIFGGGTVLVRNGDTFTQGTAVNAPGTSTSPAFNYNGGYLFSASSGQTNTENVKAYEYEGPNLAVPAVISVNNSSQNYQGNVAFPMFDGEG